MRPAALILLTGLAAGCSYQTSKRVAIVGGSMIATGLATSTVAAATSRGDEDIGAGLIFAGGAMFAVAGVIVGSAGLIGMSDEPYEAAKNVLIGGVVTTVVGVVATPALGDLGREHIAIELAGPSLALAGLGLVVTGGVGMLGYGLAGEPTAPAADPAPRTPWLLRTSYSSSPTNNTLPSP